MGGRDLQGRFDGSELLGDRVLPEDADLVVALDEGEGVLVGHSAVPDLGELIAVELERDAPVELIDGLAGGVGDDAVDVKDRPVEALETLDAQPGRLDEEMDEGPPGGVPGDLNEGVVLDVVGGVLDLDDVPVLEELLRIGVLDALIAHLRDLLADQDVGRHGGIHAHDIFARDERHRDVGHRRVDGLPQLAPGLEVVRHVAVVERHELLGAVPDRGIEDIVAGRVLLEEDDVEGARHARAVDAGVEPDLERVEVGLALVPRDVLRLAQGDVDAPHVGPPAAGLQAAAEVLVGVLDAAIVFVLELVLGRVRVIVPGLPEGGDEHLPFPVVGELQEDILLLGGDDVDDLFFEPGAKLRRQVLDRRLLRGRRKGGQRRDADDEDCDRLQSHDRVLSDQGATIQFSASGALLQGDGRPESACNRPSLYLN